MCNMKLNSAIQIYYKQFAACNPRPWWQELMGLKVAITLNFTFPYGKKIPDIFDGCIFYGVSLFVSTWCKFNKSLEKDTNETVANSLQRNYFFLPHYATIKNRHETVYMGEKVFCPVNAWIIAIFYRWQNFVNKRDITMCLKYLYWVGFSPL